MKDMPTKINPAASNFAYFLFLFKLKQAHAVITPAINNVKREVIMPTVLSRLSP
jgi:hypothetical protein